MSKHLITLGLHKKILGAHNVNINTVHRESFSLNDKIAHFVSGRVGTMWFCYGISMVIFWWATLNLFILPALHIHPIDPMPFSLLFFFLGGIFQTLMLPMLMVAQNLDARHSELRAELDLHINQASFEKLEHIEHMIESEVLSLSDAVKETLEIVKFRSQAVALTSALDYVPPIPPPIEKPKGKGKA